MLEPSLRAFGRVNDWVGEKIFLSRTRLALATRSPPAGRSALSAYSITWNRKRVYPDPPPYWMLQVGGLVRSPTRLTLETLAGVHERRTLKHHCVEGFPAIGTWTGVPCRW